MSRPTILSVAMLAIGVVLGAGALAVGQKAADRRAEPGRYTSHTVVHPGDFGEAIEITDHQTNTLYVYFQVAPLQGREPVLPEPELKCIIDLSSAGQHGLKVTYVNPPKKEQPKK